MALKSEKRGAKAFASAYGMFKHHCVSRVSCVGDRPSKVKISLDDETITHKRLH